MKMPHIWTLAALAFVRFFDFRDFCSAPAGSQANSGTHQTHAVPRPLSLELYFSIFDPGAPETTPDYLKIGYFASRSIQKVYMLISLDRTPTGPHLNW